MLLQEKMLAAILRPLDELDHSRLVAVADGAYHHAETGTAFSLAVTGDQHHHAAIFRGCGNVCVDDSFLALHALFMAVLIICQFGHGLPRQ